MNRRLAFALALFLLGLPARADDDVMGGKGSWTIGKYRVSISVKQHKDGGQQAVLEVFDGAKSIYRRKDSQFWINPSLWLTNVDENADYAEQMKPYKLGEDVLGLGAPSIAMQGFSGGAHCCFSLIILVLGDKFRALPVIDLKDADGGSFKALRPGAPLSFTTNDFAFAYWWAPFADSAAPPVVLSYDAMHGRYDADPDLMRIPAPEPRVIDNLVSAAIDAERDTLKGGYSFVPHVLTDAILRLIYGGHITEARTLLDEAWIGPPKNRDLYWSDLTQCQLRKSAYWPAVAALNGLPAAAPILPCPRKEPDAPLGSAKSK